MTLQAALLLAVKTPAAWLRANGEAGKATRHAAPNPKFCFTWHHCIASATCGCFHIFSLFFLLLCSVLSILLVPCVSHQVWLTQAEKKIVFTV